jgi:cyclic pyranopterin phosphate synthase
LDITIEFLEAIDKRTIFVYPVCAGRGAIHRAHIDERQQKNMASQYSDEKNATRETHLTHLDESGNIHMVDVTGRPETGREAIARARVRMASATIQMIETNQVSKGSVLEVAKIAGIMAAKQTPQLIPLCHPLPMTHIDISFKLESLEGLIYIEARTRTHYKTGVDVEALTAATVAALTIYDMCKGVDTTITLEQAYIASKSGGKSGTVTFSPEQR